MIKDRDCPRHVQRAPIHQPLPRAAAEQRRSPRGHPASTVTTDHDVAHEGWADPDCPAHWMLHCAVEPQISTDAVAHRVVALGGRNCPTPPTRPDRLFDPDDHRIGPDEVLDVTFAKARLPHPDTAIGARVAGPPRRLEHHKEAHQ
jgi:hypothetical protein